MPMPMDEQLHRAMPGSPSVEIDPRDPRVMSAPFDLRLGMDAPDYFSAMGAPPMGRGAFGPRQQRNLFPPGFEPDAMMSGPEQYVDELVRR
jgi:hypothetical protein